MLLSSKNDSSYRGPGWTFSSSDPREQLVELAETASTSKDINEVFLTSVVNQTIAHIAKLFPKNGDTFQIPTESDNWKLHTYTVEEIPLCSPQFMNFLKGNFFFDYIRDQFLMCAYGLTSTDPNAPPLADYARYHPYRKPRLYTLRNVRL